MPLIARPSPDTATVRIATGESVTLVAESTDTDAADGDVLRFRWQRDGADLPGAAGDTVVIPART